MHMMFIGYFCRSDSSLRMFGLIMKSLNEIFLPPANETWHGVGMVFYWKISAGDEHF